MPEAPEAPAQAQKSTGAGKGESNGNGGRRNILFITTDQQRYDSLGCNGGTVARTPVVDRLAAEGITYRRAYNQNTVCMPAAPPCSLGSTCGPTGSSPTASRCPWTPRR